MKQSDGQEAQGPHPAPNRSALPRLSRCLALAMVWFGIHNALHGQAFGVSTGETSEKAHLEKLSYAWEIAYRQPIQPWLGLSFDWNNEGHLPGHHRDGQSIQAWYPFLGWHHRWGLAFGAGPYCYYDTLQLPRKVETIHHGFGEQYSLEVSYTPDRSNWSVMAEGFIVNLPSGISTIGIHSGVAYHFGAPQAASDRAPEPAGPIPQQRLTVSTGVTVLNTRRDEVSVPLLVEYRRALSDHWALALGYAGDGENGSFRRQGVTLQGWLGGFPGHGPVFFGVGLGPEVARTPPGSSANPPEAPYQIGIRTSIEAGWRFSSEWSLAIAWHRTLWPDDGDTDQMVTGLIYTW